MIDIVNLELEVTLVILIVMGASNVDRNLGLLLCYFL